MKRTLLVTAALALSLTALPAMAQGYYSRYDTPITGAQMSDYPSSRANTTLTGSMLSVGSRYDYDRDAYNRERASYDRYYDRDRDYYYDRDRDYYGR
ncbi:MAG TPA: hypothetical protein VN723_05395 [Rhizomicrobium sp.]|jgi:hypothetical protein|nr:hypothetical protein [Rhizomicrobium sp.]